MQVTDDYFGLTLPNEFDKNRASGPIWNSFLAAQGVLGSRVLFSTSTAAQLLLPVSSGIKKTYDKHHIFPANFFKGGPYDYAMDQKFMLLSQALFHLQNHYIITRSISSLTAFLPVFLLPDLRVSIHF
ncbi:hypothetical protein [Adlercreutzia sp. ZJ141]|uniref:hypothetical protein n=1 Tax=Adlercreutzia sp. ZJ141 TaxID=2709406 RepID=UPI0013EBD69F|nr:hypothetical protein [Adlercreutzia sp. ZJ141]